MKKIDNMLTVLQRVKANFSRDISGAFSLMWAVSMTTIMISIGAGYDLSRLAQARALAQITADNAALAASIAVDTGNDDRLKENISYDFDDFGAPGQDFTKSIKVRIKYDVVDNPDSHDGGDDILIARATVKGTYKTAFMGILSNYSEIEFSAVADATYPLNESSPASIFFVVDNSGSMSWPDDSGAIKLTGLKTSMISFMDNLNALESSSDNVLRTALFPYNNYIINNKVVEPKWGTLSDYNINTLSALGGTNSTPALTRASNRFRNENTLHKNKHGNEDPLKFLVFMSDGANATGGEYRNVCNTKETWELHYWGNIYRYHEYQFWFSHYDVRYRGFIEVCEPELIPGTSNNDYSLEQCTAMKAADVKIYGIAYDVGKGSTADNFMKACSSGVDEFYKYAEDGTDLQSVFDQIGESIVKEVVRLKR